MDVKRLRELLAKRLYLELQLFKDTKPCLLYTSDAADE